MAQTRPRPNRLKRPWRLRTRLSLALVALFVAIAVLVVVSHYERLSDIRESRVENLETVNETLAEVVDGFARDLESFALSTAITLGDSRTTLGPAASSIEQDDLHTYLGHLVDGYSILGSIFVTDPQGRVIASNRGEMQGLDLSSQSYVKALQDGDRAYWSEAVPGAISGQTTVAYSRVISSPEGTTRGFLVITFSPGALSTRLPDDLPTGAHVILIDQAGTVLFSSRDEDVEAPPANISSAPAYAAASRGEHVLIRSGPSPIDEGDRYGSFVGLHRTDWVVGLTLPASAIDGPLERLFQRELLVISAILLIGLATMLIIASRLSRPLTTLAGAASAIARGERPVTPIGAADADVSQLALAMEEMSRAIAEREERLRTQATILEAVERTGESLATQLEFEKVVTSISEAGVDVVGAQAALFLHKDEGDDGTFRPVGAAGDHASFHLGVNDSLTQRTLKGENVLVADLSVLVGRTRRLQEAGEARLPRSLLGVPVRSRQGEAIGGLFLLHSLPRAFNHYHQRLAVGLARWASIVLDNARLYSQAQLVMEQLRKSNFDKDEFLGVLSHELRTPITTIYGGARFLRTRRDKLTDEARDEMIASIAEESERLYRLVEDLLAIARTEISERVTGEPVSVAAAIEQATRQAGHRYPGRPLEVRISPDLPPILAEPTYLQQIITNLISNADKYSDAGLPIEIEVTGDDTEISIRVLDRGPAVAADELAQIFEGFYRSESTSGRASGKGLGLTVCKRLVEALSGRIWARLRPEGGLEVGFAFPIAQELASTLVGSKSK